MVVARVPHRRLEDGRTGFRPTPFRPTSFVKSRLAVFRKGRRVTNSMVASGPDLSKILELEKNRKLEGYKELLRLCLLEKESLENGNVSRVADVLMLKHEVIRALGEIEARIVGIKRAIAESRDGMRVDLSGLDREITALMNEIMVLEDQNRKALAQHAGWNDGLAGGTQPA